MSRACPNRRIRELPSWGKDQVQAWHIKAKGVQGVIFVPSAWSTKDLEDYISWEISDWMGNRPAELERLELIPGTCYVCVEEVDGKEVSPVPLWGDME